MSGSLCAFQYFHLTFWILVLNAMLLYSSGAICAKKGSNARLLAEEWVVNDAIAVDYEGVVEAKRVRHSDGGYGVFKRGGLVVPVAQRAIKKEKRRRDVVCVATLFADLAGNASLNAGGRLQHLSIFRSNPVLVFFCVPINECFVIAICRLFKHFRIAATSRSLGLVDEEDEVAIATWIHDTYHSAAQDSENEISRLAMSYMTVQGIRFVLSGGLDADVAYHFVDELYFLGFLFCLLAIGCAVLLAKSTVLNDGARVERIVHVLIGCLGMCSSWCTLLASQCMLKYSENLENHGLGADRVGGRVLVAVILSLASMVSILILDKVDDNFARQSSKLSRTLMMTVVGAVSVLVGFSWEYVFEACIDVVVAGAVVNPLLLETLMGLGLFAAIVPIWKRNMLKKALQLEDRANKKYELGDEAAE